MLPLSVLTESSERDSPSSLQCSLTPNGKVLSLYYKSKVKVSAFLLVDNCPLLTSTLPLPAFITTHHTLHPVADETFDVLFQT